MKLQKNKRIREGIKMLLKFYMMIVEIDNLKINKQPKVQLQMNLNYQI